MPSAKQPVNSDFTQKKYMYHKVFVLLEGPDILLGGPKVFVQL